MDELELKYVANQIKEIVDIVDVLAWYGVVRPNGFGNYRCYAHDDESPSMMVKNKRTACLSGSCGKSDDVFGIVMYFEKVKFPVAIRILDDRYGLGLTRELTPKECAECDKRMREWQANREREKNRKKYGKYAWSRLNDYAWYLRGIIEMYRQIKWSSEPDSRFVEALHNLTRVEYLLGKYYCNTDSLADEIPDICAYIKNMRKTALFLGRDVV